MAESLDFLDPFRTSAFGYNVESVVDIEIQPVYDGSVNIITACEGTAPRIVNSRQRFSSDSVELVVRSADNLDNTYDNLTIAKTVLIPKLSNIIPVLSFIRVRQESGNLLSGGYKYYFRLKTSDGLESPIIEESRLVSVHQGTEFGKSVSFITDTYVNSAVEFLLENIDTKVYKYVSVYYTRAVGQTENTVKTCHRINKDYEILSDGANIGTCQIVHTGFEGDTLVDISEITAEYSPIDSVKTITQKNNRLLLGNIRVFDTVDDILKTAALKCYIRSQADAYLYTEQIVFEGDAAVDDTYANPYNIYHKLGYFPGETYEFAINFVFDNGTVSPAYPIMGMDYYMSVLSFDTGLLGQDIGFIVGGQNSKGVVRMQYLSVEDSFSQTIGPTSTLSKMNAHSMHIDTTKMVLEDLVLLTNLGVISYFVSRKKRLPNMIMEGLVTLAATAMKQSMYPKEMAIATFGMNAGYGLSGSFKDNMVLFPLPGSAMPYSTEKLRTGDTTQNYVFDGVLYAPLADFSSNKYYAFYSPDITSDTASSAIISTKLNYSLIVDSFLSQNIAYKTTNLVQQYTSSTGTRLPYSANPYRFYANPRNVASMEYDYQIKKLAFIDDGVRAYSSMNFTGRLDRQTLMVVYTALKAYATSGNNPGTTNCTVLWRSAQRTFSVAQLANDEDTWYTAMGKVAVACTWDEYPLLLMSGIKYSPYLGLVVDNSLKLTTSLSMVETANQQGYFSGYALDSNLVPSKTSINIMGGIARIFNDSNGPLTTLDWIDKYNVKRGDNYFAISRRFSISTPVAKEIDWHNSFLTGGDCYSGIYYQRVWRPGGIDGVPTASSPVSYSEDGDLTTRNGINITNSGYAVGFPVRSRFNFALRASDEVDEVEMALYGKPRTYTSAYPEEEVHGNRQPETSVINYGNMLEDSILEYPEYDPKIPYIELQYNNRVVVSDISITGEFVNGFRDFRGFNFKDYDEDKGPITALVSSGLYTYIVYKNGVSLIEISERTAITKEDTNVNVYVASADVLPPKATPIFTDIGSQHLQSIMPSEFGLYGVDANSKRIWKIGSDEKAIISDMKIQSTLNELINTDLVDIKTSFDVNFNEMTFTFIYDNGTQKSILYNTMQGVWCGTTDMHKIYQFSVEDKMYSIQKPDGFGVYSLYYPVLNKGTDPWFKQVGKTTSIDLHDGNDLIDKDVYTSYIEFVIRNEALMKFNLSNIVINGNGVPSAIDIIAESLSDYTVDPSAIAVSGILQDTIPVHTNIFMADAITADLNYIDEYRFERTNSTNYKDLRIGDRITLDLNNTLQQFTIANVTTDTGVDTIVLNTPMANSTMNRMYYGWKIPVRISLGEVAGGKVKLTVPSKKHSDLIKNIVSTDQNNHVNYANAKPYGRWVKLRLYFDGIDQIFIESIMSDSTLRYS